MLAWLVAACAGSSTAPGCPAAGSCALTASFALKFQTGPEDVGSLVATVQLSAAAAEAVTIPFTVSGTATSDSDYVALRSPLVIPSGSLSGTITLAVLDDTLQEASETVIVTLGTPTNATLGPGNSHTFTIADDDTPVTCGVFDTVSATGTPGSLDVGTWNLLFLGDADRPAGQEAVKQACIRRVLSESGVDLWAVQEVEAPGAFTDMLAALPEFRGLLSSDATVLQGASNYTATKLKVGLVWNPLTVAVTGAKVILESSSYDFAGRPPLEVTITTTVGGVTRDLVLVVLHAKAGTAQEDYDRRARAAEALRTYLNSTWPDARVLVLGDFNDDVDTSILGGAVPSPYAQFVNSVTLWRFVTDTLSASGEASFIGQPNVIDHILVSNELFGGLVSGSVQVFRPTADSTGFRNAVSDHWPVVARFQPD